MKSLLKITLFTILISLQSLSAKTADGFKLLKTYSYTSTTKVLHFEHQKSGAQVVYFQNEDTNRAINIAYRTRAYDDVGLPHIFEHAVLAGSDKYPSSNLFFQMSRQTYKTYMNASTYQLFTCFPLASLSEEQLKASIDVYLHGVFNPMVLTEENDLKREAVRFVYNEAEKDLMATGAVYNELKGVFSRKEAVHYYNLKKDLFPGSVVSSITGGKPEDILTVKWQQVKDFHKKYYTPSNMVIFLYGKLNYEDFLSYFDSEFLCNYEKQEVDLTDYDYKPYKGNKDVTYEFPVSEQENTHDASIFEYSFTLPQITFRELNDIRVIQNYFNRESSWLNLSINDKFPKAEFYCDFDYLHQYPVFSFNVKNINEEDKSELKQLILEAVDKISKTKIDKAFIDIYADGLKMETILNSENPDGVGETCSAAMYWAIGGSPVDFIKDYNTILDLAKTTTPETVYKTVCKYFVSPEQSITAVTKPVAGLAEKKSKEEKSFFKNLQNKMSKSEIDDLIKENKDYEKWLSDNEKVNLLDSVKVVTTKDLPEEQQDVKISDSDSEGFRVLYGNNTNSKYFYAANSFSYDSVPENLVFPAMLYFAVLTSMPTQNYTLEQLDQVIRETFYSYNCNTLRIQYFDGGYFLGANFNFLNLNEKSKKCFDLMEEILLRTDLSDKSKLKSLASRILLSRKQSLINSPHSLAFQFGDAFAHSDMTAVFKATTLDYWKFLDSVTKMNDEQMDELIGEMEQAKKYILNKNNICFESITSEKQHSSNLKLEKHFISKLDSEKYEHVNNIPPLDKNIKSIGIIIPGNVYFNLVCASQKTVDSTYNAKQSVITRIIYDKYLFPELRYKYGAYDAISSAGNFTIGFLSYRDPNVKNTFRIFKETSECVGKMDITDSDIDGYVTALYSDLAETSSMLSLLSSKIGNIIQHDYMENKKLCRMRELKSFTKDDIKPLLKTIENVYAKGIKVTVGGAEQIYENKDMYDLIITDFIE